MLELNSITERLWYNDDISKTMRLVVSAKTPKPIVWSVTKIENAQPIGIQRLTLYQNFWNPHNDYVDEGGLMYADYYDSAIEPIDTSKPEPIPLTTYGKITATTSTVKIGGSYKTLTVSLFDADGNDITENYLNATFIWSCDVDGDDLTEKVNWLDMNEFNKRKIKFFNDRSYLTKILNIKCTIIKDEETIETTEQFELSIS